MYHYHILSIFFFSDAHRKFSFSTEQSICKKLTFSDPVNLRTILNIISHDAKIISNIAKSLSNIIISCMIKYVYKLYR